MNKELTIFRNFGLSTPTSISYSKSLNAFVGTGFTSFAGNTYFNSMRLTEGLVIKEDIGIGYYYSFLNGLHIYDLKTKTLICEKTFHCYFYSREAAKSEAIEMLTDMLIETARKENKVLSLNNVRIHISQIVNKAYYCNQTQELNKTLKLLSA